MKNVIKNIKTLKLKGECTIYQMTEVRQKFLEFIQKENDLKIKMKAVTRIVPSFVQLLLSAKKQNS